MGNSAFAYSEFYHNIISLIDCICDALIDAYCCVVWTGPFLNRKSKAWLTGGVYAAIMLFFDFIPWKNPMLAYALGTAAIFFVMYLTDREHIAQKLFVAVTFFCLQSQAYRTAVYCITGIYEILIRSFLSMSANEFSFFLLDVIMTFLVYDLLTFIFFYGAVRCILWSYGRGREPMSNKEFLLLSVPSLLGVVSYGLTRYYSYIYERDTNGKYVYDLIGSYDLIMLLFTLFSFAVIFVITYVFRQWKTQQEEDRQREIFSTQMADLQSHISEVERLYRDLRSLRHDMGNHLMTLEQLYENGEYEAAEQYAGTLRREIQNASGDIASGNPVTDVILSGRKKEMEEKEIAFACDFHYPMTDSVNSFDVSIILNNALSNAIEAVEREQTGSDQTAHISLSSHRRKNMYIIEVSKSYTGTLELNPATGLPCSSKTEEGHGFGLTSIRHVARKYLGDIEIGKEICEGEERCVLRVMLQITEAVPLQKGQGDRKRLGVLQDNPCQK